MLCLNLNGSNAVVRTLKRRVLIRRYDYDRMVKRAVPLHYDTATFEPVTRRSIEQEKIWSTLKNRDTNIWLYYGRNINQILDGMKDWTYNPQYLHWKKLWNEQDVLCVQSRSNHPPSELGWATFTVDYDTNPLRIC